MSRLGKLPPLQSIGRAKSFDFDYEPEEDSDVDNLILEYETIEKGYRYEDRHAYTTVEAFSRMFKVLQPGGHICKRSAQGASSFAHCKQAVDYAQKYHQLKNLLEKRAKLEFMNEYCTKVNQCAMLVRQIEGMVQEERLTWLAICRNNFQAPPSTKLEHLGSICEDLRVNMHHWNSLKQLVHTNQWLRSQLPTLCQDLEIVKNKLCYLRSCAVWWIERLIHLGFRVMAHCDPNHFSQDILWGITRGLEEYNSIITVLKNENTLSSFSAQKSLTTSNNKSHVPSLSRTYPSAYYINSNRNLVDSMKAVPFSKVLHWLANERSKYAAAITHQFFTSNTEFLTRSRIGRLPEYSWGEERIGKVRPTSAIETSDYYTQSGSNVSLGSAMLKIGTVVAPDLSKNESPIAEFASREEDFAMKFLHVVSKSTNLLKRPSRSGTKNARASSVNFRPGVVGLSQEALIAHENSSPMSKRKSDNVGARFFDEDALSLASDISLASSSRKSVSWCDASEMNITRNLAEKYMRNLWQCFGQQLVGFFHSPILRGTAEARTQLGNILIAPDMVVQIVITMIHQTCLKDIFPSGAEQALHSLGDKLLITAAKSGWLKSYSQALASSVTDKCQARPLRDGAFSTTTTRYVRDAYQPLYSWLVALQLPKHSVSKQDETEQKSAKKKKAVSRSSQDGAKVNKVESLRCVLRHYVMTSELASQWCVEKIQHSLAQRSIPTFLLLTHSDLKLVSDELSLLLRVSEPACSSWKQEKHIDDLWSQLNDISSQLQKVSGAAVKEFSSQCKEESIEFLDDNMPRNKLWRKKAMSENPAEHNDYIANALQQVVAPVISGVSKLPPTSQISTVSIAVTALCEAWTDQMLRQRIKFSYAGACQLGADVRYVQNWLSDQLDNAHVRHSVLALDVLKHLEQIVHLLQQQPHPDQRSNSAVRVTKPNAVSHCDPSTGTDWDIVTDTPGIHADSRSRSSNAATSLTPVRQHRAMAMTSIHHDETENGGHENGHDYQQCNLPNSQQWLALRVHGGSRHWPKLPNCFHSDH